MDVIRRLGASHASEWVSNYLSISDLFFQSASVYEFACWCGISVKDLHVVSGEVSWNKDLRLDVARTLIDQRSRYGRISIVKQLHLILGEFISLYRSIDVDGIPVNDLAVISILNAVPGKRSVFRNSKCVLVHELSVHGAVTPVAKDRISSVRELCPSLSCVNETNTFDIYRRLSTC